MPAPPPETTGTTKIASAYEEAAMLSIIEKILFVAAVALAVGLAWSRIPAGNTA